MINVVDIFAGPGGLGEGFSACKVDGQGSRRAFQLKVSAEMEASAHSTLRLRAFYRLLRSHEESLKSYFRFMADPTVNLPYEDKTQSLWDEAGTEALQLTLGNNDHNRILYKAIESTVIQDKNPWILIGGPPCQAYSLIGRSRNKGKSDYKAEQDHRHYLYKEYLHILDKFSPDAFIMENVRGILSSKIDGSNIFGRILEDLASPAKALGSGKSGGYDIVPLADYGDGFGQDSDDPARFLIYPERHGIPQARHRVILLGIRRGTGLKLPNALSEYPIANVRQALAGLPALRSGLSKGKDGSDQWCHELESARNNLISKLSRDRHAQKIVKTLSSIHFRRTLERSVDAFDYRDTLTKARKAMPTALSKWLLDPLLHTVSNHDTRGHMKSDLARYLYMAAFAKANKGRSPTSDEFPEFLAPNHKSWGNGNFKDRFKVQSFGSPSSTITSHIAKDGHHFIHPDPSQCRSLTVREAARLQTFPDNYFFMGNRTQQYHQVGNAVPPLLANRIARLVSSMFS